jgi:hypothetical protein
VWVGGELGGAICETLSAKLLTTVLGMCSTNVGASYVVTATSTLSGQSKGMVGSTAGSWSGAGTACSSNNEVGLTDTFVGTWTAPTDGNDINIGGSAGIRQGPNSVVHGATVRHITRSSCHTHHHVII